jgi:hypothetical protein
MACPWGNAIFLYQWLFIFNIFNITKTIIMPELNEPVGDFLADPGAKSKLPGSLNALTILTFIGSALAILGACYNFISGKKQLDQMEAQINSPNYDSLPSLAKKFVNPEALEMMRKGYENRFPIFLISLVCIALCVYGAMQMRQRKMQGYYLYLAGEILAFVPSIVFVGIGAVTGIGGIIFIVITLLFVLLYTGQRKYLIN